MPKGMAGGKKQNNMKRILIVCLLGIGLLLPSANTTAKEFFVKRIVDVTIEGYWLLASSDESTGNIIRVKVYKQSNQELVIDQKCSSGYTCMVDMSGQHSGYYIVQVITTLTSYSEIIYLSN